MGLSWYTYLCGQQTFQEKIMYNDRFEEDEQYENAHLYDDIMYYYGEDDEDDETYWHNSDACMDWSLRKSNDFNTLGLAGRGGQIVSRCNIRTYVLPKNIFEFSQD